MITSSKDITLVPKETIENFINNLVKNYNINNLICNEDLLLMLSLKAKYMNLNKHKINTISYHIKFNEVEQITPSDLLIDTTLLFKFNYSKSNITSNGRSDYLFLLKKINSIWLINNIYSKEQFNHIAIKPNCNEFLNDNTNHLKSSIENINSFLCSTNKFPTVYKSTNTSSRRYDKVAASLYAQTYALDYNKDYLSFDGNGGDCTNFVSQALKAGGVPTTRTWKPYTNPWIRVKELRDYLIYNKLASEKYIVDSTCLGCVVQFYNDERKAWTHSGIISYVSDDTCLYCCHSYDKLNYPLEFTYPILYPKIRILCPY